MKKINMKKILLLSILFLAQLTFAQEIEIIEVVEEEVENPEVPFSIIENPPVYEGCQNITDNEALKNCFVEAVRKHVGRKFNTDLANNLGLQSGPVKIFALFKIDSLGNVKDIRARAPHPKLEEETLRVISLIPQMHSPGFQRGKPVTVNYALPIIFTVVGTLAPEEPQSYPLTKDEIKALKKLKKKREKELKEAQKKKEKPLNN